MADEHVVLEEKNEKSSIFPVFNKLLNARSSAEKTCVLLFDALKGDGITVGSSNGLSYSCKRLIRGLASSQPKRQSLSFATLVAALQNTIVSVEDVLLALESEVNNNGQSRSEHGMSLIISTLTCGAVVKSRRLTSSPPDAQLDVIKKLVSFGIQKQYLRNALSSFFVELMGQINKSLFKSVIWPIVKEETERRSNLEDEWYAVLFVAAWSYPKTTEKLICKQFGSKQKFCEKVIIQCPYYPILVQDAVVELLISSLLTKNNELIRLLQFLVEHDHKITPKWSLFIVKFCKSILNAIDDPSLCLQILRPEILSIIFMSFKKVQGESEFRLACKALLEILVARLVAPDVEKVVSLQVTKHLLFNGDLNFDRRTRSRTVQMLIENLDAPCIKSFLTEVKGIVAGVSSKASQSDWTWKNRQFFLNMLGKLTFHPTVQHDHEFILSTIKFLFKIGFLKSEKINSFLRMHAKDVFFKVVELRNFKMDLAVLLLSDVIQYVNRKLPKVHTALSETAVEEWKNVLAANAKLQENNQDKKDTSLRLLLLHMALLLFRDVELASTTVQELLQCYNRIKETKKRKNGDDDEEPHWVEVIVDLMLALLSRENKLLRHVVTSVFPSIASHLTPTALQQIVDALDPNASNDILGHVDSDNSDEEEGGDEEEENGDLDDSDSDLEDEETEHETVNDKLRMAVRNALGYSAALTDDDSVDMDDMNEEEESRLNESLANAFRMFRASKSSNKKQSKDDEARTHFRVRVLDLVETIVTSNPTLGTCLDLVSPLFALLEFAIKDPHQKPLQNRLETILRKLSSNKKFRNFEQTNLETVIEIFKGLFERDVSGLVYTEMSSAIVECSVLLVRAAQLVKSNSEGISLDDIYVDLLNRYFKDNDRKVPFGVFEASLRLLWDGNWTICKHIMSLLLDEDLKVFKKSKLLDLLGMFYRNDRLQSTATDDHKTALCTAESKFVKKLSKLLEKSKFPSPFYLRLLQLVQNAISSFTKYRKDCPPIPKWKLIIKKLLQCSDLLKHQKTKSKLMLLAKLYNIPVDAIIKNEGMLEASTTICEVPTNLKRKASTELSDSEHDGHSQPKKIMKKKMASKQARLLAKESRELREAASSQGLQDISFCSVPLYVLNNEGEDDEDPIVNETVLKVKKGKKKTVT